MFSVTSEMSEQSKIGQNQEGPRERTQRQFSKLSTPDFLQTTKLKTLHRVCKLMRITMACFKNYFAFTHYKDVNTSTSMLKISHPNASCCDAQASVAVSLLNLFALTFIICVHVRRVSVG